MRIYKSENSRLCWWDKAYKTPAGVDADSRKKIRLTDLDDTEVIYRRSFGVPEATKRLMNDEHGGGGDGIKIK